MRRAKDVWNQLQAQAGRCPRWAVYLVAALLLFGAGFGCGYYRRSHLYDHTERAESIEQQLEQAADYQQRAAQKLQEAEQANRHLTESISDSRTAVEGLGNTVTAGRERLTESQQLLDQSQSILDAVRRRGEADTAAH